MTLTKKEIATLRKEIKNIASEADIIGYYVRTQKENTVATVEERSATILKNLKTVCDAYGVDFYALVDSLEND